MGLVRLLDIKDAANQLGVPCEALRKVADEHRKTILIGRAVRLHPDDIPELLELCRVKPKDHACTGANESTARRLGKSEIQASPQSRPARKTAEKLKSSSKRTSPASAGQVVQFNRTK